MKESLESGEAVTAPDIAVIIIAFNEQDNIGACVRAARQLTPQVYVVDSFSTDRTVQIARESGATVYQNAWTHYAGQRNWAMDNLPITADWIAFLDADESLSEELRTEVLQALGHVPNDVNGFYCRRTFVFLGRPLRYGGYGAIWVLRIVRRDRARVLAAASASREYFQVTGRVERLQHRMIHYDRKPISEWIRKHDQLAGIEARVVGQIGDVLGDAEAEVEGRLRNQLRARVVNHIPPLLMPLVLFLYRYIVRLGFLDGFEGLAYYFLHDFWFPFLIAVKQREMTLRSAEYGVLEPPTTRV